MVSESKAVREILFRGKENPSGKWVEGFYNHIPCGRFLCDEHLIQTIDTDGRIGQLFTVYDSTVGQFTGLTDKNGKKIFEDDICRVSRPCVIAYGHIEFANGCFWFVDHGPGGMLRLCDVRMNGFTIEVIGNIHDNPELLEGRDG